MSHVQLVNDVTGNKVFFKKLKSDETKFGTCSFLMPMWLIRAQLTWLYSVSWAGGGGWWFGTGHLHAPRCFFVGFFFSFFKTCGDQLTHIASAGAISETLHSSLCTHKRHCIIILHMQQHSATTGWWSHPFMMHKKKFHKVKKLSSEIFYCSCICLMIYFCNLWK